MTLDLATRATGGYPADLRGAAGIKVVKAGLRADLSLDLLSVQQLSSPPVGGLVPVQDPVTGQLQALDFAQLPTAQPGDGTVTNVKAAPMPAQTLKVNATNASATPQDAAPADVRALLALGSAALNDTATEPEAVTFVAPKLPSVQRVTAMLKATGTLSLTHAGCIADNASSAQKTINTAAMSALLDDPTVRQILVPPGSFTFNTVPAKTLSRGLQISGCGAANTQLAFDSNGDGLVLTQSQALAQITVNGLSMANASTTGSGRALAINYPATVAGTFPTVRIFDFATRGLDIANHAWGSAIALSQCWNAKLGDLHLSGAVGSGKTRLMKNAIIGTNCTGISIGRFKVYYSTEGVVLGGGPSGADTIDEGFSIYDFEIVDVDRGIYHATSQAHAGNGITDGHINASRVGIELYAKHKARISDVELYKVTGSTQAFVGIQAQNCNGLRIHDILFVDSSTTGTGACNGLVLIGSSYNIVHDLQTDGVFAGGNLVTVGAGSDRNRIHNIDAAAISGAGAIAVQAGAGLFNTFKGILPAAFVSFPANAATPSVANDIFGAFATANTSATTITNFANGNGVQRFTLKINDAVTTLQHNANLILKGFVNATPPNGGVLDFILDGTTWREVARNF